MTDTTTAQMVLDLKATDDAVRAKGWVAPGLGVPGAPLGLLGSALNPLSGLAAAGLGWFTPLVSFLGEGLTHLQGGNAASVTSGARDFGDAGQDIAGLARSYRDSTSAQTSGWSGAAASEYREAGAQHADGIAGLGQASTMTGSAIIGAGQVVAQAIAEVTELIAEAVAEIVPIMTQAVARAGETFGQSVVEAIPPCVGIAVTYAARIAAKLAALVASGDNLMKLVQGGMAVVDLIRAGLSNISQQSIRPDAEPQPSAGAGQPGGGLASPMGAAQSGNAGGPGNTVGTGHSGGTGSPTPTPPAGGFGGGAPTPVGPARPLDASTQSSGAVSPPPAPHATTPDASRPPAHTAGVSTPAVPSGAAPTGTVPPSAHAGPGRGADAVREKQPARATGPGGATPGGLPLGAMGGARAAGDADKEHQRKYTVVENHNEPFDVAPPVIGIK